MSETTKGVFLSYASQDSDAARRICDALRAAGVEVWFDQSELVGGDAWDAKIRGQIGSCALFVPIISAHTQARLEGYFRREWKQAAERTRDMADEKAFLLPVVIDATRDTEAKVPAEFKAVQWTRLPGGETPPAFAARVQKLLSGPEAVGGALRPDVLEESQSRRGGTAPTAKSSARPWLVPAIAATLAVASLVIWQPWNKPAPPPAKDAAPHPTIAEKTIIPADDKSVAVLAFANLSDDKGNDSFGDSVSEELLNVLAKVPGLKVTARTSAFHFKGKDTPIPEIARQLGVAYVVEGSVRRSGDKVRITAQLIKAEDGFHVWSDTFTRDFKDIFAVQDEIAGLIADNLQLKLGMKVNRTAMNPEAYQFFLEAARAWNLRNAASVDRAEQLLRQALALQPVFPRALALMANVFSVRAIENAVRMGKQEKGMGAQALDWAERALAIDPELGEGHAAKGNALDVLGRWPEARAEYRRSTELAPNYATGHQWYARSLSQEGYLDESIAEMRRAAELDPLAPRILDNLSAAYSWAGRLPEALEAVDRALVIQPGSMQAQSFRASYLILLERYQEARPILEKLITDSTPPGWVKVDLARCYLATGRQAEAEALLTSVEMDRSLFQGILLCVLGRPSEGMALLQPSFSTERDVMLWTYQAYLPRESPEFQRKLAEWGMAESWQRAEAWRAKHLPKKAVLKTEDRAQKTEVSNTVDQKSVAVLAFANLSDDKGNEYFSDGISEELLNVLAKVPGLKVSARTSAFYFKGKEVPIPEIAQKLGVAYVVEGSVRKSGDKVRITAQLIKAADGFHVWSDTFTRDLKDIFAVQDEIAGLIAKNLQLKMGVGSSEPRRAVNPEALRLMLEGRYFLTLRSTAGFDRAERAFTAAMQLDPQFAQAQAGLASTTALRGRYRLLDGVGRVEEFDQLALAQSRLALQMDPALAEPHATIGFVYTDIGRLAEAEQEFQLAFAANPNYATAYHWHSHVLAAQGRLDLALQEIGRAEALDPVSFIILYIRGFYLTDARHYAEALAVLDRAAALRGESFLPLESDRARTLLALGRTAEALATARKVLQDPRLITSGWYAAGEALYVLHQGGAADEAARLAPAILQALPAGSYQRGYVHCALGNFAEGLGELAHSPDIVQSRLYWHPMLESVHDTPQFRQLLEKLNAVTEFKVARATLARMMAEQAAKK